MIHKMFYFLLMCSVPSIYAQTTSGMTGLLNIPSADTNKDGDFMIGGNFLPQAITPEAFSYNSGNYYINATFLPFIEVAYTLTFLKVFDGSFNQDRSISTKIKILNENDNTPSLAVGINDIISTGMTTLFKFRQKSEYNIKNHSNQYYRSMYITGTKKFDVNNFNVEATFGWYTTFMFSGNSLDGIFGGIRAKSKDWKSLEFIAEYDSQNINIGASLNIFNGFKLHALLYQQEYITAGLQYKFSLFAKNEVSVNKKVELTEGIKM
ncbi:MAG: YjbH domain-containing protein [Ichthyobacteriaceae bacterium]|nr:YjbH domain-containing protein [Ichthyobacteriaceae bacterium]